jgi:ribonuclease E
MEDSRNDRHVEKRLRDAVKNDRARVQIGKISQFGLMEMSRQRLRAGVVAGSTVTCPHCGGQGIVRSVESTALRVLRGIEEEGQRGRSAAISVKVTPDVAIFTLNKKRGELARLETEYAMAITFEPDSGIMTGTFEITRTVQRSPEDRPQRASVSIEAGLATPTDLSEDIEEDFVEEEEVEEDEEEEREEAPAQSAPAESEGEQRPRDENGEGGQRKRRRRGGRGRNRDRNERGDRPRTTQEAIPGAPAAKVEFESANGEQAAPEHAPHDGEGSASSHEGAEGEGRKRRRRRRGRRGRREDGQQGYANNLEGVPVDASVRDNDVIVPDETREPMVAKPNAESAPVWSLGSGGAPKPAEAPSDAAPKKGWWQRAFSSKD